MEASARLASWCEQWLRAAPREVLFERRQLSYVVGILLDDQRAIVIKVRKPAARLRACTLVHRQLWAQGYPCPELLVGPVPFGDLAATAEAYLGYGNDSCKIAPFTRFSAS